MNSKEFNILPLAGRVFNDIQELFAYENVRPDAATVRKWYTINNITDDLQRKYALSFTNDSILLEEAHDFYLEDYINLFLSLKTICRKYKTFIGFRFNYSRSESFEITWDFYDSITLKISITEYKKDLNEGVYIYYENSSIHKNFLYRPIEVINMILKVLNSHKQLIKNETYYILDNTFRPQYRNNFSIILVHLINKHVKYNSDFDNINNYINNIPKDDIDKHLMFNGLIKENKTNDLMINYILYKIFKKTLVICSPKECEYLYSFMTVLYSISSITNYYIPILFTLDYEELSSVFTYVPDFDEYRNNNLDLINLYISYLNFCVNRYGYNKPYFYKMIYYRINHVINNRLKDDSIAKDYKLIMLFNCIMRLIHDHNSPTSRYIRCLGEFNPVFRVCELIRLIPYNVIDKDNIFYMLANIEASMTNNFYHVIDDDVIRNVLTDDDKLNEINDALFQYSSSYEINKRYENRLYHNGFFIPRKQNNNNLIAYGRCSNYTLFDLNELYNLSLDPMYDYLPNLPFIENNVFRTVTSNDMEVFFKILRRIGSVYTDSFYIEYKLRIERESYNDNESLEIFNNFSDEDKILTLNILKSLFYFGMLVRRWIASDKNNYPYKREQTLDGYRGISNDMLNNVLHGSYDNIKHLFLDQVTIRLARYLNKLPVYWTTTKIEETNKFELYKRLLDIVQNLFNNEQVTPDIRLMSNIIISTTYHYLVLLSSNNMDFDIRKLETIE